MKFIKKAGSIAVSAALVLSLCSCGDLSWAAKIGDEKTVPIGLYIYGMAETYRTAVSNSVLSTYSDLDEQTVEVSGSDVSAVEYLDDSGLELVKSYVGAYQMFIDMGFELSEDEIADAAEDAESVYETDEELFEENGVAESSIEEYYLDITRKSTLFYAIYGEDGTDAVSDEELNTFFYENYAATNFIQQYFYNDDGTAMSEEEQEALIEEYESIRTRSENGEIDFEDVCEEYSENATSYLGGYTNSVARYDTTNEDGAEILALEVGEFTMFVTDSAIALVQKVELDEDGSVFDTYRETLLISYKYDDFIDELADYCDSMDNVKLNTSAFEKFSSSTRDFTDITISSSYS